MLRAFKAWIIGWLPARVPLVTGRERVLRRWVVNHADRDAKTARWLLKSFKHVIEVNPAKFFAFEENGVLVPVEIWNEFSFPHRRLEDSCMFALLNCSWENGDLKLSVEDQRRGKNTHLFVATNSDDDALLLSLLFS